MFHRREIRDGSGGPGRTRGGLGQVIELGGADGIPLALLCNFERVGDPRFIVPFTALGGPIVSIPVGAGAHGLPLD